ncbi:MAG: hypothetical protein LBH15_05745 [Treponema sp.]|nr:hypothetical protein [Treponema sp.]
MENILKDFYVNMVLSFVMPNYSLVKQFITGKLPAATFEKSRIQPAFPVSPSQQNGIRAFFFFKTDSRDMDFRGFPDIFPGDKLFGNFFGNPDVRVFMDAFEQPRLSG